MQVEDLKPCPNCSAAARSCGFAAGVPGATCRNQECPFWFIRMPVDAWNRLSRAAELARAVERLSANTVHISANVIGGEAQPLVWLVQSQHGKARAEHLTAALIALAKKVQE